jgi:hypothetical protein
MSETDKDLKQRNKQIAENESDMQATSAVRLSTWAIAVAVVIGLALFGWVVMR